MYTLLRGQIPHHERVHKTREQMRFSADNQTLPSGAVSAELSFVQATPKEIGLKLDTHARAASRTARAVATKQGAKVE